MRKWKDSLKKCSNIGARKHHTPPRCPKMLAESCVYKKKYAGTYPKILEEKANGGSR